MFNVSVLLVVLSLTCIALYFWCRRLRHQRNILHKAFCANYGMWDVLPEGLECTLNQIEGRKNKKEK